MASKFREKVVGMGCGGCVTHVQDALTALPGVTRAKADLATGMVEAEYDSPATPAAMAEALGKAGYPVAAGA